MTDLQIEELLMEENSKFTIQETENLRRNVEVDVKVLTKDYAILEIYKSWRRGKGSPRYQYIRSLSVGEQVRLMDEAKFTIKEISFEDLYCRVTVEHPQEYYLIQK